MNNFVACLVIIVCSAIPTLGQDTGAQTKAPVEKKPWPNAFAMHDADSRPLAEAGLSDRELSEIKRIAINTADPTCRNRLREIGDIGLFQKLLLRRIRGSQIVVLEGGADWEDSIDNCFLGRHLNVATWVIDLYDDRANLLLQTMASGYTVIDTSTAGNFDMVIATAASSEQFELTWWRYEGLKFQKHRCATEHDSAKGMLEGASKEVLKKTAKTIEHKCR